MSSLLKKFSCSIFEATQSQNRRRGGSDAGFHSGPAIRGLGVTCQVGLWPRTGPMLPTPTRAGRVGYEPPHSCYLRLPKRGTRELRVPLHSDLALPRGTTNAHSYHGTYGFAARCSVARTHVSNEKLCWLTLRQAKATPPSQGPWAPAWAWGGAGLNLPTPLSPFFRSHPPAYIWR